MRRKNWISARREILDSIGWCADTSDTEWCWEDMIKTMSAVHSIGLISRITGIEVSSLSRDMKMCGIKIRPRGGANNRHPVFYKGKMFETMKELFDQYPIRNGALYSRVFVRKMTIEQALKGE